MSASTRTFATGACRDADDDKLDYEGFLSPAVLERFALYMHENRRMADGWYRASDNWQKGMPRDSYMKSLARHHMDVWGMHRCGDLDGTGAEDALCAVMFNAMGLLFEVLTGRDVGREDVPPEHDWPEDDSPEDDSLGWTDDSLGWTVKGYDGMSHVFQVGDRVRVRFSGSFPPGTVRDINDDGIHVKWDGKPAMSRFRWQSHQLEPAS